MKRTGLTFMALAILCLGCKDARENQDETLNMEAEEEQMMDDQNSGEEISLFNGEDLEGWKAYKADEITKWTVEDGALVFTPSEGNTGGTENLLTEEEYTNFELSLEWKISEAGNSGIMWGVQEMDEYDEPYYTGPEIQILDNTAHPDAKNGPVRQAGALYDMVEPSRDVTKPAGEWNSTVIRINYEENRGSVTLNGTLVTEFPLHGEEWEELVDNSKFSDWEDFGSHRTGHIALQDHGDKVWFRNIRIKELN